jgi:two-component system nitrogen regulation sensor histidine kinase GlnL
VSGYLAISSFLNFLGAGILAFAVAARGRRDSINIRFGVFAFAIGCWSAAYFLWQIADDANRALFATRLLMFFAYFVPVAFFHFIAELCGEDRRWWVRGGYATAVVLAVLNFTPRMVASVGPEMSFPFWPRAGSLYWIYLTMFGIFTVQAGYLLVKHLRDATGSRATQLRNILIASIVGFGGGATNFPLWYGVKLPPLGNLLIFLYLVIMAHAVSRYQLPLVTYDFVHASVQLGLAVTFSVFYLLLITTFGPLLGYEFTSADLAAHFLVCIVVCLFFLWAVPRVHRFADRILAQTYLRRRHSQQQGLRDLGVRLVSLGSEQEIFENTTREIAKAFNLEAAVAYARTEFDRDYQLRAVHGWPRASQVVPLDSVLVRMFQERQGPLIFDGSEMEFSPDLVAALGTLRDQLPIEAAFPIASDDFISGILLLGAREGGERYTEAEITLLESLCLQVAVTLRARQLERRASQTEKLIALGTLAAGLAHELRNPLTSIQTFSALLKESRPDPDSLHEFSGVVQRDVNRIASIVENVAAFAESNKVEMNAVNLADVLRTVAEIIRPEADRVSVVLSLETAAQLPAVRGNHSQLLQVFLNLSQNALQAMESKGGGQLKFAVELRTANVPRPQLCASVTDNGPGIDPLLQPRIFEPFTTTKSTGERRGKHGMGLGLAIVKRIVQHHHGEIHVASTVGQGTTFRVYLPPA